MFGSLCTGCHNGMLLPVANDVVAFVSENTSCISGLPLSAAFITLAHWCISSPPKPIE